jgi:hypothetical protein
MPIMLSIILAKNTFHCYYREHVSGITGCIYSFWRSGDENERVHIN